MLDQEYLRAPVLDVLALNLSAHAGKQLEGVIRSNCASIQVAAQLLEQLPSARVVALTGGIISWYNAGAPMEDADGNLTTELHPGFNDEIQEYIQFAQEDLGEDDLSAIIGSEAG
jgi:hypothetical protein